MVFFMSGSGARKRRRAIIAVQVVVMLTVLVGFAALTVDVGTLYRARSELQAAADAGALAAASTFTTDEMLQVRLGGDSGYAAVVSTLQGRAADLAGRNDTLNDSTTLVTSDVVVGWIDVTSGTSPIDPTAQSSIHNAVRVTARRSPGANGPVEFFFAPIFGLWSSEVSAVGVAAFDDRFEGYALDENGAGALPMSVDETLFAAALESGDDIFAWDEASQTASSGSDGLPEVNIYPHDVAPGNFGLLNIGTPNQGTPALRDQIENGVDPADMEAEIGSSEVTFYDADGSAVTYAITGNPGMKSALESSIESRVDDVVAFFIHDGTTGTGSNTVYNITGIRFGRVMGVSLTGAPSSRGVWLQPVIYGGGGVAVGPDAPSTGGLVGRLVLVR